MHKAAIIKIVYWSNKRIIFHTFAFESFSTSFTVYLLFIFHLFNKLQVDCSLNQNLSFKVCYVWPSSSIWLTDNTNSTQYSHSPPTRNRHDPRHARNNFWVRPNVGHQNCFKVFAQNEPAGLWYLALTFS